MSDNFICPKCGHEYVLGVNGTMDGCDECLGVWRNFAGQIVEVGSVRVWDHEEDSLTDMEKA